MKKFICLILSLVFVFSFCACSGSGNTQKTQDVFDSAKATYENLIEAYELVDTIGTDLYEAWRVGIYDTPSISTLDSELSLTSEELNAGVDSLAGYEGIGDSVFYLL